jgi:hypothetical protein
MADKITEAIGRVRVKKVEVVLSEGKVLPRVPTSGLWPRVTLELDGTERTVPLTWWADEKKAASDPLKAIMEGIGGDILRMAGGRTTASMPRGRRPALEYAVSEANSKIRRAVDRASQTKGGVGERHRKAQKRALKKRVLEKLRGQFESLIRMERLELEDLGGADVGRAWDDILKMKAVRHVMET